MGTPIDLDNCAREPIHIPGSIQPRGVLAVLREPDFEVRSVSANVSKLLGKEVDAVLGRPLSTLIGAEPAAQIQQAALTFGDLRQRNPLECAIDVAGQSRVFDAILHREPDGTLLVELEIAYGERPFSFPNTYLAVRSSVEELNRASTLTELYDTAARAVRQLTGFDRVMVYRYDEQYNGEVVAEAKREDLNSFLGLHYPSTDIPVQARKLYERNWIRLISDVDYAPVPILPAVDPGSGTPLDLTYATLRSVSPIHVEYLQNMGVHASMSISLLRQGRLWGLIACHHYAGPHLPPFGTRAAAEFLGSTLSLRLVDRFEDDKLQKRLETQAVLAKLIAAVLDDSRPLTSALLGAPDLLDLVPADSMVVKLQDETRVRGPVPPPEVVSAVAAWALDTGDEIAGVDSLSDGLPHIDLDPQIAAGALALNLPDGQYAIWFRREALRSVDWGGDPHNKAIAVTEGNETRLSPRKSFERWREEVRGCSEPWTANETEAAEALRHHLVEALYRRTQGALRVAETLQRSLLPLTLPTLSDWQLAAYYEPASGGRVGGDWYDAFELRDGRLVVLLGDVAGHGITAAGTMAQMRNVLRAQLFSGAGPAQALAELNDFCLHLMPKTFATVLAARVDLSSGYVEVGCAGHLIPYLTQPGAAAAQLPVRLSPPVGVRNVTYTPSAFTIEPGQGVTMFSDGLVEHRGESLDGGIARLGRILSGDMVDADPSSIATAMATGGADDDVTIVTLRRA
ncbi:SpoIIE family protein phosphatase [Mycolicibacterium sphagni]|uniref:SpoIIE family protein phosphatase n=1 Tax=Mycolicibacterium sphagni TaxID=1786 RepID=UPI0026C967DA